MTKRAISFLCCILVLFSQITTQALCAEASSLNEDAAQEYLNVLENYEGDILKQDHVPFSNVETGTVALLDVTGDGQPELLFLTFSIYYNTDRRLLNIFTIENGSAKQIYQGQINFNAVGSQTEYVIYRLGQELPLYSYTSFSEGSEGTTTNKRLTVQDDVIIESTLECVYHYADDSVSYYLDDYEISEENYITCTKAWNEGEKQNVILNMNTDSLAITYDEAIEYLRTQTGDDTADVKVRVNDTLVVWTDAKPFIDENSRTMVPLRAVADALGLLVDWNAEKKEAVFGNERDTIFFPIGSNIARTSSGSTVQMDTAAVIVNGRTYAPVRYLAEYFGFTVGWDGSTRTVRISGHNQPTEAELRAMIPASKVVQLWVYKDYDFDGQMEAFALAISTDKKTDDTIFDSVFFVNSNGAQQIKENRSTSSSYASAETCCREYGGKVFFAIDNGAGGSGYNTLLFSVKNGAPYELELSGSLQGFFEQNGKMCTTMNDFSKGYHTYPVYELIYDAEKQEFSIGAKIADDSL